MKYIIIDLEMNPVDKIYTEERKICKSEVIEIGAVMLDDSLKPISDFKQYVKPQYNSGIMRKYELLTGITNDMVKDASNFCTAFKKFIDWCESFNDKYQIYAWSENDLLQIMEEMQLKDYKITQTEEKILDCWHDFQKEYMDRLGLSKRVSLQNALIYAGQDFEGRQHDAFYDAKNTAELFIITRDEEKFNEVFHSILEVLRPEPSYSTLGELFDFSKLKLQFV